jgi:MFS family permease
VKPTDPHAGAPAAAWIWPLAATLAIQTSSSFLGRIVPTVAPVVTSEAGMSEASIGYMSALSTCGSVLFLMAGHPLIRRFGPIRALQAGLLLSCFGLAMLATPHWSFVLLSNLVLGLGYGPSAPAGSDILLRHSPPKHRTLIFSLKQAGVPAGGVIAGLLLPWLIDRMDWKTALLAVAFLPLLTIIAVQPVQRRVDAGADPSQPIGWRVLSSPTNLFAPLRMAMASPVLRALSLAAACFAVAQGTIIAFSVTYVVQRLGYDLVAAGVIFAVMQVTGILGRIGLGWLADRLGSNMKVLALNALAMGATQAVWAMTGPSWSFGALVTLAAVAGVTITSWNGVQLAEIARLAPPGRVSEGTAGATLVTFLGYIVGPAAFASLLHLTGSYSLCFAAVGLLGIVAFIAIRTAASRS